MIDHKKEVERWGIFEYRIQASPEGNPYTDVSISAEFISGERQIEVSGFYDGGGIYVIRFMPEETGLWQFTTKSNLDRLNNITGDFICVKQSKDNHGPVRVKDKYHFAYSDGTAYLPFGTTCYAWAHQTADIQKQTLESLEKSPFNKLRMCVFPKRYSNNNNEPEFYPFEGTPPNKWDYTRFNPDFFKHLEGLFHSLTDLGIQIDLILFHPYDEGHWGFDRMDADTDRRYLQYVTARFSSFRNIWWSLANEFDYMKEKSKEDWDRNIQITAESDPYSHLLSIHQGDVMYEHWNPYITHASIQLGTLWGSVKAGFGRFKLLRDAYQKPVIYDEVGYEGNLPQRWGRLSANEMVDKFWHAIVSGTYMTHGETFTSPEDIIWWSKGGTLKGKSPKRIEFLRSIIENSGIDYLEPLDRWWVINGAGKNGDYYLYYFGLEEFTEWKFELPAFKISLPIGTKFQVDVIDTWNMTITPIEDLYEITDGDRYSYTCNYNPTVELPGKKHMALQIRRVE